MLRRKAKRLGKKAFKFRFVTTVLTADLEAGPEWCVSCGGNLTPCNRPILTAYLSLREHGGGRARTGSLVVQWVRHGRNVATDPAVRLDDYNGRIHAEWHEPLGMVSTLYKVCRRQLRGSDGAGRPGVPDLCALDGTDQIHGIPSG